MLSDESMFGEFQGVMGNIGTHSSSWELARDELVNVRSEVKSRFVVFASKPLNEPVVQCGPFIMNIREQIMQAFQDYSAGKFKFSCPGPDCRLIGLSVCLAEF